LFSLAPRYAGYVSIYVAKLISLLMFIIVVAISPSSSNACD
jgi:hypothetical protein